MSSGFVSETELAEQRKRRQEEWEKVRTADQPLEAPEEVYDPRSLFDRLEEQRKKKDEEYEEAHKLKNMVRGLDDDEVDFLDTVERLKENLDKKVRDEERAEIEQFRSAVATLAEQNLVERLQKEIEPAKVSPTIKASAHRSSQQKLLAGAVIRKKPVGDDKVPPKKMRAGSETVLVKTEAVRGDGSDIVSVKKELVNKEDTGTILVKKESENGEDTKIAEPTIVTDRVTPLESSTDKSLKAVAVLPSTLRCVGILPGLGSYPDSSDSERSSDSESELPNRRQYDLVGRVIERVVEKQAKAPGKRGEERE